MKVQDINYLYIPKQGQSHVPQENHFRLDFMTNYEHYCHSLHPDEVHAV